jgi:hypothetical protein
MATNFAAVLDRTLAKYSPEDGEYIDLAAFFEVFAMTSKKFWESSLLGCGTGGRTHQVKRLPLLGRKRCHLGKWRVVVLVDSLREWLAHYNPDKERTVEALIEELQKTSRRQEQKRRRITIETKLKNPLGKAARHHGGKSPSAHPLEKLDFSAMKAWG